MSWMTVQDTCTNFKCDAVLVILTERHGSSCTKLHKRTNKRREQGKTPHYVY